MGPKVEALALENLQKVVKAVGAKMEGCRVHFKAGKQDFRVEPSALYRVEQDGAIRIGTCIQSSGLHPYETMASVILLLRNNPDLFELWRNDTGHYYG